MGLMIRIGPFTFGKNGLRLNLWKRRGGVSIPLQTEYETRDRRGRKAKRRNRTFGIIRFGLSVGTSRGQPEGELA